MPLSVFLAHLASDSSLRSHPSLRWKYLSINTYFRPISPRYPVSKPVSHRKIPHSSLPPKFCKSKLASMHPFRHLLLHYVQAPPLFVPRTVTIRATNLTSAELMLTLLAPSSSPGGQQPGGPRPVRGPGGRLSIGIPEVGLLDDRVRLRCYETSFCVLRGLVLLSHVESSICIDGRFFFTKL